MARFSRVLRRESGFTFLELLLALSVLSLLLFLSVPVKTKLVSSVEEKLFLETLHNDFLYLQKQAMSRQQFAGIEFREKNYLIRTKYDQTSYIRPYPSSLDMSVNRIKSISFNHKGTIKPAGTIKLKFNNTIYKYICPLGKGRCYFEK